MAAPVLVRFQGGDVGPWRTTHAATIKGDPLPEVRRVNVVTENNSADASTPWTLRGVVSHPRYATGRELKELGGVQEGLGRPAATCAALIPIRKSDTWWTLGQDQRRAIFEGSSQHIARSMRFLPAIARRLHHARDLGEPFDFITWFEFAPEHSSAFDELLAELRQSPEWAFVDREIDIRLVRE